MSVKFEKDTIKQTAGVAGATGINNLSGGKHDLVDEIGTALTGGKGNIGTKGYLAAYLKQLQTNPLRTKMLTSGTLSALQEILASWIAKDRNKNGHYFTTRVPKMAAYGAFISAPLGHVLISILQKLFAGRTSLKAKILQIIVSNLVHCPHPEQRLTWSRWPSLLAQRRFIKFMLHGKPKFLPEHTWVPFFNIIGFVIGTYVNSVTKKKRLAALRKRYQDERGGRPDDYPPPGGPGPKY
ncbi:hypothetical protein G7Y89_g3568 [Cudoniella acicularis]|uniref:Peroxisomal membrane protein PMP22 n=1 Tax=Cudoniella acicularis TaxID=354080 RepID=A0A8H4RT77_9HELO|nr:hypothetical protein G7Y89_g3568 [Cudoniella acicularis]